MAVWIIFTAQLKEGMEERYSALSQEVLALAQKQPGLIFMERGRSAMRERGIFSVSRWESEEAIEAWRNHPLHRRAQEIAVRELFQSFKVWKTYDKKIRD